MSLRKFLIILFVTLFLILGLFLLWPTRKIQEPLSLMPQAEKFSLAYTVSGCQQKQEKNYIKSRALNQNLDFQVQGNSLTLFHHLNYVCCADLKVTLDSVEKTSDFTLLKIKEKNVGEICRCLCDYDLKINLNSLEDGKYKIQLFGVEFENQPGELLWEKELEINTKTRKVLLYFYNPEKDKDAAGNMKCSKDGLVAIEREIPFSENPIEGAINLLLKGKEILTEKEMAQGLDPLYPLNSLKLKEAKLKNDGTLILEFDDPMRQTSGGACRVGILWAQIEATAKQFEEVKKVQFQPEDLFQP